ncbi:MAG: alpha/beta hydrolase family protein [Candidatus Hydrogenedentes bacterium]|nr:alpha/beta hydrolase family protein [Candidatus Hydrogenedentota bacterium]
MHTYIRVLALVLLPGILAPPTCADEALPMRTMAYTPRTAEEAKAWQKDLRAQFFDLLHMRDLVEKGSEIPLDAQVFKSEDRDAFRLDTLELRVTPGRVIQAMLAVPAAAQAPMRAVVAIHGHGGSRMTSFDPEQRIYKLFGAALAKDGFVVISTDVGQHEVYEEGRTLMGERLWDLMRCVDYLRSRDDVDPERIGCAGLSLGGEMAMWLGAMDPRIAATVSAGFLTYMDQMEQNHCMCWKFDGLRELVDFPDIYAMIAPRPLQCQNGLQEPRTQFTPDLARKALLEIVPAYRNLGAPGNVELIVHEGGHEIALEPMVRFLQEHLRRP